MQRTAMSQEPNGDVKLTIYEGGFEATILLPHESHSSMREILKSSSNARIDLSPHLSFSYIPGRKVCIFRVTQQTPSRSLERWKVEVEEGLVQVALD